MITIHFHSLTRFIGLGILASCLILILHAAHTSEQAPPSVPQQQQVCLGIDPAVDEAYDSAHSFATDSGTFDSFEDYLFHHKINNHTSSAQTGHQAEGPQPETANGARIL